MNKPRSKVVCFELVVVFKFVFLCCTIFGLSFGVWENFLQTEQKEIFDVDIFFHFSKN